LALLCIDEPPTRIMLCLVAAYRWASARIAAAGMPVSFSAHWGVYCLTCVSSSEKPVVWLATKAGSYSPSPMMTWMSARASAASVPGRIRWASFACSNASLRRTSMATIHAPRRLAATMCGAVVGWLARLAPQRTMRSEWADMSSLVLTCTGPVSDMPKPPRPQQTIAGSHH
jgi:hypothetical protein